MEQRITAITLGVSNLANAKRFYVDGLGWKPAYEDKEIIFFQAGGMVFALFLRDKLAEDFHAGARPFGRAPISLGYSVREKSEVAPLMKRAADAGATILAPAQEKSWGGHSGYFADPDGFAWEIAWNPGWPLTAASNFAEGGRKPRAEGRFVRLLVGAGRARWPSSCRNSSRQNNSSRPRSSRPQRFFSNRDCPAQRA
jgi:uncharacterized protein